MQNVTNFLWSSPQGGGVHCLVKHRMKCSILAFYSHMTSDDMSVDDSLVVIGSFGNTWLVLLDQSPATRASFICIHTQLIGCNPPWQPLDKLWNRTNPLIHVSLKPKGFNGTNVRRTLALGVRTTGCCYITVLHCILHYVNKDWVESILLNLSVWLNLIKAYSILAVPLIIHYFSFCWVRLDWVRLHCCI